jgi:hypothetical protein
LVIAFRAEQRSLEEATSLAPILAQLAHESGRVTIASAWICPDKPAVALGRFQSMKHVLSAESCSNPKLTVARRHSGGTAVYLPSDGAALWVLALPQLTSLYVDTVPSSTINRNIRGFLRGFSKHCAPTHYFGREWISTEHRPSATVALAQSLDRGVELELWCGAEQAIALPLSAMATREQQTNRWLGKQPIHWTEAAKGRTTLRDCMDLVSEFAVSHLNEPIEWRTDLAALRAHAPPEVPLHDPWPVALPSVPCPIGWIDRYTNGADFALGGDLLASPTTINALAQALQTPDAHKCHRELDSIFSDRIVIGASVTQLLNARFDARVGAC